MSDVQKTGINSEYISDPDNYDSDRDPEYKLSTTSNASSTSESEPRSEYELEESDTGNNLDISKGRVKKGRKRKYLNMNRAENKKAKNRNELHFDYKGKSIEKKIFIETFKCTCSKKCHTKISTDERKTEFNKYWELGSYDAQTALIGALVSEEPKKRKYGQNIRSRQFSRHYKLNKIDVCRETFIKTLGISTKRVDTALKKLRNSSITDKRGKKQGGKNKIVGERKQNVIEHINAIPKYKSHYRREQNSDIQFLPPELTLPLMYKKYKADAENPVSFVSYRRIFFSEFNLKFKPLKKDTCNTCDTFKAHIINTSDAEQKEKLIAEHELHIKKWQDARQKMNEDMLKAKDTDWLECLTFDLEKTLPLPRLPTGILFYKRQLWLYNLGVHSGSNNTGYFYIWLENEAGRGAQEIGSCLFKHIMEKVPSNVRELILWSDSCGGQNRNIKMTLVMKTLLESHPSLQKVSMRFLVSGHSFLPNDSDFSDVECALKHQQRLYLPDDYIRVMEECRTKKKFEVTRMKSTDFFTTAEIEKQINNRKTDINKQKVSWLRSREIFIEKIKPYSICFKENFEDDTYVEIDIKKKQVGRPNTKTFKDNFLPMWPDGKEISAPKLKDIKSIMHLIPQDCKYFYRNLQSREGLEDDIDGFSGSPDFDLD